jgi:alanine-synthesizing transaminase
VAVEFRRIDALPPYAFAQINALKMQLRRAGEDVIDLGFGNPDLPSPDVAVDKLIEAVRNPRNHRYSLSNGIPKLREALTHLYQRKFGVTLDFETEVCSTIGAKEGFSHLMFALVGPGDTALVPSPSYPIHIWGPILAGAAIHYVRLGPEQDFFANLHTAWEQAWPRPRVVVASFPHNPTTMCVDLDFMTKLVEFVRERDMLVVHDFAYADLGFDHDPPSILQVPGAKEVAVELYTLTKSFSMAGWRMGFLVGNAEVVAALARLKSYLDYGTFQPVQIAATVAMNEAPEFPKAQNEIYRGRRDTLLDGLDRIGWQIERPKGTMFVWAPIPEPYSELTSQEFAQMLVTEAKVAVSPGSGFGPGGEGFVRFALVENEQRISQAVRGLRKALTKLG